MKKTIALVIPTLQCGGAERVISLLANEWVTSGHDVHLVILKETDVFYFLDGRIRLHRLNFVSDGSRFGKFWGELMTLINLYKALSKLRPDFVLSFLVTSNILTLIVGLCLRAKIFVSERSSPNRKIPFFIDFLRKCTYPFADGIIVQTQAAYAVISKSVWNKNIMVIPNPVSESSNVNVSGKEKIILSVGRLIDLKGHDYLIRAFARINAKDWTLLILGEGPNRQVLEDLTVSLGVDERVEMPGQVLNVSSWYERSSIFVLTSLSEGFPNALLEAMAAGLPCISFDCVSGPSDLIEHKANGLLVPVGDLDGLSDWLRVLVSDAFLRGRLSEAAKTDMKRYAIETVSDQYLQFCLGDSVIVELNDSQRPV
jgi:GalNAc-alpha-(1->4)-GalNAc-alpha-(1->3)-diNAcBac-PP-undecaprenol alpha-1,4-N-acetyl-D-galactosaminyltransferase